MWCLYSAETLIGNLACFVNNVCCVPKKRVMEGLALEVEGGEAVL